MKKGILFEYFFVILALVKRLSTILVLLMLMLTLFPHALSAERDKTHSEILRRMFDFQARYSPEVKGKSIQIYTKHYYQTYRRNFGLWLIPSMYTIARGKRSFLSEEYSKITITGPNSYEKKQQVFYSTIPHNRRTMSILEDFNVPNLYSPTLYGNHLLSPFCRENSRYYKYKVSMREKGKARIDFLPRVGDNTQLVSGTVIISARTGRIYDVVIRGEYDMISFFTEVKQDKQQTDTTGMPRFCKTDVDFQFLGNHIVSSSKTFFGCDSILSDSINIVGDRETMAKLRPKSLPLTKREIEVLAEFDSSTEENNPTTDNDERHEERVENGDTDDEKEEIVYDNEKAEEENGWDVLKDIGYNVGTYLVSSHGTENKKFRVKLSPILQPQYVSYSKSRGFSYKLNMAFDYHLGRNSGLFLNPTVGYNFKIKKVYAYVPLRYLYNKKKGNYLELSWDTGNRIGNSSVLDELKDELGELPELDSISLDEFDDSKVSLRNFTQLTPNLRLEFGCVYHQRTAVNKYDMKRYGKAVRYRTLAPSIGLHIKPWKAGPVMSINYERSIKCRFSDIDYERWETQLSQKFYLPSTKLINIQLGGGLYTRQFTNYFLDFEQFTVNNLPGGWDDEWTGDFQLLDSRLYNISNYYISTNFSYDAPLLFTSFIPFVGKYVERERLYWSGLLIEYNRPYHEFGYGFTTRFFSVGLFSSFHELDFKEFGAKFTIELFHRW